MGMSKGDLLISPVWGKSSSFSVYTTFLSSYASTMVPQMSMYAVKAYEIPEIADIIFDQLHTDKRSLASCALVCTDWALTARSRLFASIRVRGRDSQRFLAFVQSPHATHIRRHVRSLQWEEGDGDDLEIEDLCNVVASLPQVDTLHLSFNDFKRRPTSYNHDFVKARLSRVHRLSLRYRLRLNKTENTVQPLLAFLSMFCLDSLELDGVFDPSETAPVDSYRVGYTPLSHASYNIRSISIVNGDSRYCEAELLARLVSASTLALESLAYQCHSSADVQALGSLVKSAGRTIRSLELALHTRGSFSEIRKGDWEKIYLQRCIHLDTLRLPNFWNHYQQLDPLLGVLVGHRLPLRHITLGATPSAAHVQANLTEPQWQSIGKWLKSFAHVETIYVDLRALDAYPDQAASLETVITRNLHPFVKSGRLRIL